MSTSLRLFGLLLAVTALAPALGSANSHSAPGAIQRAQSVDEEPQEMFRWAMTAADLGEVTLPRAGAGGGWAPGPNGLYYRSVPAFTADPTYEVIIRAPHSGSALYAERILVQIPANFAQKPFAERAVVVGFHSFSVSEKDIFLNTNLPFEAAQRGWMLVAPYGLTDTSFASPQSQASLEAVFHVLYGLVPFNYRRIYAVGFSMGGLNALSYGMRHLDRLQLQFAGIVAHTSTLDMLQEYADSTPVMQWLLANSRHFQGTPQTHSFEYERVSPVQFRDDGLVDAEKAPVLNIAGRPIYLHTNLADPRTDLVAGMGALATFLQQRGAHVVEHLVHDPAVGHHWSSLPLGTALDYVAAHELGGAPEQTVEMFADNPGRWLHTEVESISPDRFGRFRLELAPVQAGILNSFALLATRDLDEIRLKTNQLGLDATTPLRFLHESSDGTADTLRIAGFANSPTSVTVDDQPATSWSWQATSKELVIEPTTDGRFVKVDVHP